MYDLFLFGNQLFPIEDIEKLEKKISKIILVESMSICKKWNYHKAKLATVLCSMREYKDELEQAGYKVVYYDLEQNKTIEDAIKNSKKLLVYEPADIKPKQFLLKIRQKYNIEILFVNSPMFLTTINDFENWKKTRTNTNKYFFQSFYVWQRKRLNLLVDNNNPVGGKWSLDEENRSKIKDDVSVPMNPNIKKSKYFDEIEILIEKYFPNNPGTLKYFWTPCTRHEAKFWLEKFCEDRLLYFGDFEDAISYRGDFLFHSAISPLLNIGLLTPSYVIKRILFYYEKDNIKLNNIEGFIRQIIGWREFMHLIYLDIGDVQQKSNHFRHKKKIDSKFYNGETGFLPVDEVILKAQRLGWAHHIERLMILGNFMLLKEYDPNEVYKWFMEMFIDAYEWVMIPNVYGMSQYADGGMISTKPYFSASNYIIKMSEYKRGLWSREWDKLFWNFIKKHEVEFSKNPRLALLVKARPKFLY